MNLSSDSMLPAFFSPYSKDYCLYFYIVMIITFIFFVVALFQSLYLLFKQDIGVGMAIMNVITPFLLYFTNRLMYSMCVNSLQA